VVVCDNGSTDGTGAVAASNGAIVVTEPLRGYGAACLAGLAEVRRDPPGVVVFLDAVLSDRPEALPSLLTQIADRRAEHFRIGLFRDLHLSLPFTLPAKP
jgi:hypothetical protein